MRRGRTILSTAVLAGLIVVGALNGCSSNGGNSSNNDGGGGGKDDVSAAAYLFYSGSLFAVDPTNPGAPIAVETSDIGLNGTIPSAGFDAASLSVSNIRNHTVVYEKGGQLFKVAASKSAAPSPTQLSSEADAADLCEMTYGVDWANVANSQVVYRVRGTDGSCGGSDDQWRMVRVGLLATDAPVPAKQPVWELVTPSTGALAGWLGVEGKTLYQYDANFGSPTSLASFTSTVDYVDDRGDTVWLRVDNTLRAYRVADGTLTTRHTFSSTPSFVDSQIGDNTLYFADNASVYKVPMDGSADATLVVTDTETVSEMVLTTNRVVYRLGSGSVKSVLKTGGSPTTLESGTGFASDLASAGARVYYTVYGADFVVAKVRLEDGTEEAAHSNAMWIGKLYGTAATAGSQVATSRVILAEGVTVSPDLRVGGSSLSSYDAATHTVVAALGSVPSDVEFLYFGGLGNTVLGMAWATGTGTSTGQQDIFFANTEVAGSLQRVTNTSDKDEVPVEF